MPYTGRLRDDPTAAAFPEPAPCPICGTRAFSRIFPDTIPWLGRCPQCGLTRADPQPDDEDLEAIYDEHYYEQFGFVSRDRDDQALSRTKRATYGRMLDRVLAHLPPSAARRRVLDVGCGLGYSLVEASERGFDALGLDPLARQGTDRFHDREIVKATLANAQLDAHFDVVSAVDVIEHVRDPAETVRDARKLLRPNGLLMLATNDVSSRGARTLGHRWTHYHRAHLWFFTPESLSAIVAAEGFEVLEASPAHRVYNFEYIASILARGDNFPLAKHVARLGLRALPRSLQQRAWPPVTEGFVLIARRTESAPTA